MNWFLLRHALAVEKGEWRGADKDRPLTPKGEKTMQKVARALHHLPLAIDQIVTSPYKRAYDTAALLARGLKWKGKIATTAELSPDGDPERFIKQACQTFPPKARLVIVGHEPYFSTLLSRLVGVSNTISVDFKKGGLCRVDVEKQQGEVRGTLKWFLTPKLIKRLS